MGVKKEDREKNPKDILKDHREILYVSLRIHTMETELKSFCQTNSVFPSSSSPFLCVSHHFLTMDPQAKEERVTLGLA